MTFITISAYIKKSQRSQMYTLTMYLKDLKKTRQTQIRKRKEIIMIRAENKEMEIKRAK
jgi:hypothetical protein